MSAPVLYESHSHTPLCKHAVGDPAEYAAVAEQRGLKGIILTCHHAHAPLHHVLGSVHMQVTHYRAKYFTGDFFAYQQTYFEHLAESAETGLFDTLAHPDLVKNEAPHEWDFTRIRPSIERALDRIARTGVAMELNTSGLNKALAEMNPGPRMLEMIRDRGIPVVLGADAHRPARVADRYEDALRLLADLGFRTVSLFLERRRREVPIAEALASLRPAAEPAVAAA